MSASPRPGLLLKALVFNPTVNQKEEFQHHNVFYSHPQGQAQDDILMDVGLCSTLKGFHANFDTGSAVSSVCTDSYQYAFLEPEPDWTMCLIAGRRHVQRDSDGAEWAEDSDEAPLRALLNEGYQLFRLHYGSFQRRYSDGVERCRPGRAGDHPGAGDLRKCLGAFMDVWIVQVAQQVQQGLDLFDTLDGIRYLPADRTSYLRMHSLVSQLESQIPEVLASCVLLDDLLLYTGLGLADTHVLFKFVTRRQKQGVRPPAADNVLHLAHAVAAGADYSGFLTSAAGVEPPQKLGLMGKMRSLRRTRDDEHTPLNVWLSEPLCGPGAAAAEAGLATADGTVLPVPAGGTAAAAADAAAGADHQRRVTLVVFQCQRALLCMLCDPAAIAAQSGPQGGELYRRVQTCVLDAIAPSLQGITDAVTRSVLWDDAYSYVYFNKMNLALKASLLKRRGVEQGEALRQVERMAADFAEMPSHKEAWGRTKEGTWVVGRRSGSREFYAVFEGKAALAEVQEEVRRISQVFFHGIFVD
eukprot:TRINITY_DN66600_c0_g1_i1.p1 TRINITY_DN66600_c0_g1~~TRINITY_DN66600_c0_g1_i1.p1  ORF type:complete len:565 (+),score=164.91 TRINITY_DN66600_c0_g1_i1:118-1695(+)